MKIADILQHKSRVVHSVMPWLTVGEVVEQLNRFGIGAVLVCDEKGGLRGIVSERDVVRALGRHGAAMLSMPLTEIMTQHVETTTLSETVSHAMARMTAGRYRHLPVVEKGTIVGVVSIGDLVKNRVREMEMEVGILRDRAIAHS
jgi:CBS domain-containing protein